MKKIYIFLIFFLFFAFPINGLAIVQPTSKFYINDYANILSNDVEDYIYNKSVDLNNTDGTQIVVVTVKNLDGYSLEDYANKLFNNWGIGSKDKNNGLLLLLALEEREFRVEVGDGLGGILPDGKTGRFQDMYIIPYLKNDDWDRGIKNGYDAFYSEIVNLNDLDLETNIPVANEQERLFPFALLLMLASAIVGIISGLTIAHSNKINKVKATILYLAICVLLLIIFTMVVFLDFISLILMINIWFFIISRFGKGRTFGGSSFGGSFSSGGGRFSGGGGRSSGGGSSRGF